MSKKLISWAMLASLLTFGLVLVLAGCEEDKGDDPKTLVIQNVPTNLLSSSGGQIGIFPVGTTPQQALKQTGIVAGAELENASVSGTTVTIPLYNISNDTRWTGSGTYTVYVQVGFSSPSYYKKDSASFSSGTTTINFSSFQKVDL